MRILITLLIVGICNSFTIAGTILGREFASPMIHGPVDDSIKLWITGRGSRLGKSSATSELVSDLSKSKNNGKIVGAHWTNIQAGHDGQTLSFDGVDDYVNCGSGSSLNISGSAITLEVWVKPAGTSAGGSDDYGIVDKGQAEAYMVRLIVENTVQFFILTGYATYLGSNAGLSASEWSHVATIYDGVNMKIYINGVLDNSGNKTGNIAVSSEDLYIGRYGTGRNFNGTIDEVRIYNRALNSAEVMERYNETKAYYGK